MIQTDDIIDPGAQIVITGANGFIGSRVVDTLLRCGFRRIRCLVRASSDLTCLNSIMHEYPDRDVEIVKGNLLSKSDCEKLVKEAKLIYHLAAGTSGNSFSNSFLNSVVTTCNLISSAGKSGHCRRFVCISSFTVYSNWTLKKQHILDESCEIEIDPKARGEAYCFGKVRQELITFELCNKYNIPFTFVRPGVVYGPGKVGIHTRIGIDTFGLFLHLGGNNKIPFTYVDNCAEAIVLAGLKTVAEGEAFNVVDDDLPTSRQFLKLYKKNVKWFYSLNVPYFITYLFCCLWEKYVEWSKDQLPLTFNRKKCVNYWRGNIYSNRKLVDVLGWSPMINFNDGFRRYCEYQKRAGVGK